MKSYPLYNGTQHTLPPLEEGNAGLHFTRFYSEYNTRQLTGDTDKTNTDHKTNFLKRFAKTLGNPKELQRYQQRQHTLITAQQGQAKIYSLNNSHLITGMGNQHIVENGFLWHYTLGVPYLSGSQLKGLLRSTIEQYLDINADEKAQLLRQWFGSDHKDTKKQTLANRCGELIFFDALPISPPALTVDIMTPHMGKWYAEGNNIESIDDAERLPADWHDPTPIPFLAVKNASFLISISKRAGSDINLDQVWTLFDSALSELGVGAKTRTGYGYLRYEESKTQERYKDYIKKKDEQQKEAEKIEIERQKQTEFNKLLMNASPFHKEVLQAAQAENWEKDREALGRSIKTWVDKLQTHPSEKESINFMLNLAHKHYETQMKAPHKIKKEAQREWVTTLLKLADQKP